MAYKSVGTFDQETLSELYDDDLVGVLETLAEKNNDLTVVEVGAPDAPDRSLELWRDDYDDDSGWREGGEFEDEYNACDAANGFPEVEAVSVFDYSDKKAKMMVRGADA